MQKCTYVAKQETPWHVLDVYTTRTAVEVSVAVSERMGNVWLSAYVSLPIGVPWSVCNNVCKYWDQSVPWISNCRLTAGHYSTMYVLLTVKNAWETRLAVPFKRTPTGWELHSTQPVWVEGLRHLNTDWLAASFPGGFYDAKNLEYFLQWWVDEHGAIARPTFVQTAQMVASSGIVSDPIPSYFYDAFVGHEGAWFTCGDGVLAKYSCEGTRMWTAAVPANWTHHSIFDLCTKPDRIAVAAGTGAFMDVHEVPGCSDARWLWITAVVALGRAL